MNVGIQVTKVTKKLAMLLKSTPYYIASPKQTSIRAPVYYETLLFTFLLIPHFVSAYNELKDIIHYCTLSYCVSILILPNYIVNQLHLLYYV